MSSLIDKMLQAAGETKPAISERTWMHESTRRILMKCFRRVLFEKRSRDKRPRRSPWV